MEEVFELARAHRRHGPNAYMLLLQLRSEYADVCGAGGTFTITPKARARAREPFAWTRERYQNSRDLLLATAFIEKVEPFSMTKNGPRPARYRLTMKGIEPTEVRRARKNLALVPSANALPI
jgi:hypothetical protein